MAYRLQRITRSFTAGDDYRTVADYLGLPSGVPLRLVEGWIQAQTNGLTFFVSEPGINQPTAAANPGIAVTAGGAPGTGPTSPDAALYDLGTTWVRNTTAGSNSTVVVSGVLATEV